MTTRPRDVRVEFLYLDRETCERCRGTEAAVESALSAVRPALALAGAGVVLDRVHVDSAATAERVGLEVSPTVRVDGRDVQAEFETSDCGCASDESVPCRVWRYDGRTTERAPASLVANAVLSAAYQVESTDRGGDDPTDRREVTRPVERYFESDEPCC
ncbi:DUF2703 domain-containing protein [Salinigranum rubrum]|nr:DUF2703 domain-containing protein [Salinigranum rubrum]